MKPIDESERTHHYVRLPEVMLHCVEAGDRNGPLVVLLHGFPEFWYAWRNQIDRLAMAGYHVLAPDLRGYNRSAKPKGVESYRLTHLTGDVAELIHEFGDTACIVGHDWGGVIAWELAHRHPGVLSRLVVCNAPHLGALARELRSPRQLRRSWYAGFFQLPWLPEHLLGRGEFGWLETMLRRDPVTPGAFSVNDIERYRRAIARPGAFTAALNYYRALGRAGLPNRDGDRIDVPTLLVWGERDRALRIGLTQGLDRWVPDLRVERLPDASHWVQNDAPDRVNELLLDFIEGAA